MTLAETLVGLSATVTLLLGTAHLYLTFFTRAFSPRDASLEERLKTVSPILTTETTLWRSQIGFHASHSLGALLFGALYLYLAIAQGPLLFHSPFLLALGGAILFSYLAIAKRYWFRRPLLGLLLSLAFYVAAVAAAYAR